MFIEELDLEITRNCTLISDYFARGEAEGATMDSETIDNVFENIATIGSLKLRGGEPLIAVAQLEKIIKLIDKKGIKVDNVTLITNGTVISERVCVILKRLGKIASKKFNFIVTSDIYDYGELKSSGLLRKKIHNTAIFREYFGAQEMSDLDNISEEKNDNCSICLVHNTLEGALTVDVYGNIVASGLSFSDEDEESKRTKLNINLMPFKEAVSRFANLGKKTDRKAASCLVKSC